MDKTQSQTSIKRISTEAASLDGSSLITMFEINIGTLAIDRGVDMDPDETIFRFHNCVKLTTSDIIWQGNSYSAAPIDAEGFEVNTKGTIPTPTLSITVDEKGISALALLKLKLRPLGDIIGAKVTRRRTFAKFLDDANFTDIAKPKGHEPDPNAEFFPDIFFINRKVVENKHSIKYELSSILDLEGIFLPRRQVIAQRCNFNYRGEGCMYEYEKNRNTDVHGEDSRLPISAPAVGNENDDKFEKLYGIVNPIDRGSHVSARSYNQGDQVYITRSGINYYFVAKIAVPPNVNINNITYWAADKCSKCLVGCRLRWGISGKAIVGNTGLTLGELPFGGFPATTRLASGR